MKTVRIASVLVLAASSLFAATETDVSYASGGETVHGKLYTPPGVGPFPALIVIHPRTGLSDWLKEQASKLSDLGFVTLAVDLFRGKIPDNRSEEHTSELQSRGHLVCRLLLEKKKKKKTNNSKHNTNLQTIICKER